ncbi:ATP-binding protein [Acinetobacter baumannii]|uniref:ATP-binding protein n=1 Tax=Acinetobacter baumannii TaxID=470 RepID=UPI00044E9C6E|nr:ATP-binding protein [Acinetobacter baumannii]EXE86765.1 histidine kinase-, DNA gyrase B-, and HSP90-like ATPase family protein [Acinetobacter baumannii 532279]MDC4759266.1 ATP-binding protein [Acinetobacter baumannii]MDC5488156.1 ATP-binding protein [Acinetobacter baumannii]NLP55856.1 ATP-binding protein [Acinetobacter baumannii]NQE74674.1 ATPase family protein [Acinetobacter baumannii]
MEIETGSAIKLFFPNPSLSLVYFEAIANALDAGATDILIEIDIQAFDSPKSLQLKVTDNGQGFTEENFNRFKTLLKPRDKYHKGIGRLVFLNYFSSVKVSSVWDAFKREFIFKEGFDGISPIEKSPFVKQNQTTLIFNGFRKDKIKRYEDIKPLNLKQQIIDHFLPTLNSFQRKGRDFNIVLKLNTNETNAQKDFFSQDVIISSHDLPQMIVVDIENHGLDTISKIEMSYHVKKTKGKVAPFIAFSIDGRTIPISLIPENSIPPEYHCVFLFESDLFHSNADSSRQKLLLPNGMNEKQLYQILRKELGKVLSENIPQIEVMNKKIEKEFVSKFPHLLGLFETDTIGLIDKDSALNIAQQKFFQMQKEILQCNHLSNNAYVKSLELSSRTLTEYILYREKIIEKMKDFSDKNKESEIHDLIVPKFSELSGGKVCSDIYQNNAWLLDDKFMVFRTILSEKRMDKVINAIRLDDEKINDNGRPDITMIFSADPEDVEAVDVVVVEIKKKTDDEKENQYAVNQLLDRALKLVEFCPKIQRVWYYAVIQVSKTMELRLRQMKWSPLYSKGKVFYQEYKTPHPDGHEVPTPTFVMSFDAIVSDAQSRNHIFLEILRDSMKKFS